MKTRPADERPVQLPPASESASEDTRGQELIARLASGEIAMGDLTAEQLALAGKTALSDRLRADAYSRSSVAGTNYYSERQAFLEQAGSGSSAATRSTYQAAIERLERWCQARGTSVLHLTPGQADDFVLSLVEAGLAAATVNKVAAGVSSFLSWFETNHSWMRNPFRGSRTRPPSRASRPPRIPSSREVKLILDSLPPAQAAAAAVMALAGLAVGALPSMTVISDEFTATSKGRQVSGKLPAQAIAYLSRGGLEGKKPFEGESSKALSYKLGYMISKMHRQGKILCAYPVHSLRHYFAVTEYTARHDVTRLKQLLGHSSLHVTESYLVSLKLLQPGPRPPRSAP